MAICDRFRKIEKIGNDWIVKSEASPNSPRMTPGCWIEIIWPQRDHHGRERERERWHDLRRVSTRKAIVLVKVEQVVRS